VITNNYNEKVKWNWRVQDLHFQYEFDIFNMRYFFVIIFIFIIIVAFYLHDGLISQDRVNRSISFFPNRTLYLLILTNSLYWFTIRSSPNEILRLRTLPAIHSSWVYFDERSFVQFSPRHTECLSNGLEACILYDVIDNCTNIVENINCVTGINDIIDNNARILVYILES